MGYNAAPLEKLIEEFSKFPGIGRKGATRMAYQVLPTPSSTAAVSARIIPKPSSAPFVPVPSGTALSSVWWKRPVTCRRLSAPGSTMECTMCSTVSSAPWMASVPNS